MFNLTADLFYGSPGPSKHLETPKKPDSRIELIHRQTPLLSNSRTWQVFERQDEALAFGRSRGNGLMTFVFHASVTEQRMFLVAHPREFWLFDSRKEIAQRCSYEVIPEFQPCKLYLDLEFEREFNPQSDGVKMTQLFIDIVGYQLLKTFHLKVDRTMVLDLDSSTEKKFSRHLIYQIPLLNFANNYQVGILVKEVCEMIRRGDSELCKELDICEEDLKQLVIKDRHGKEKLFCDEGVYTKNRHFRLYRSTKPHKNAHLVVSQENTFSVGIIDPVMREEAIFLASLVTNFEPMDIVVPLPERPHHKTSNHLPGRTGNMAVAKGLPSPFPVLDKYAIDLLSEEGIRSWVYFSTNQCLVYEALRPGFCGNIGRQHKSNKGMLVIDIRKNCMYRKCHDPDCAGYQSRSHELPSSVISSLQYPDCSEEQRKEIQELLEYLETKDISLFDEPIPASDLTCTMEDLQLSAPSQNSVPFSTQADVNNTLPASSQAEIDELLQYLNDLPEDSWSAN